MIAQSGLLIALAFVWIYAWSQRSRSKIVSYSVMAVTAAGAVLVLLPDVANDIANFVGIGRGADLVFYVFIVVGLTAIFNLHLRLRTEQERLTAVVRELALMNAREPTPPP